MTNSEIEEFDVLITSAIVPETGQLDWSVLPADLATRAEELIAEAQKRWDAGDCLPKPYLEIWFREAIEVRN
jgi:hypothetical protein